MTEIILKGRLDGKQRNRLKGLFDFLYSPSELAEEIRINKSQIYMVYVPLGCPHERDVRNHIYINGKAFAEWYGKTYVKNNLEPDQSFCLTCKKGVEIVDPKEKRTGNTIYIASVCPNCGRNLSRFLRKIRRKK